LLENYNPSEEIDQAIRDPSGELEYVAAVGDVTARHMADEALDKVDQNSRT